ncbi:MULTISPECIES: Tim44 domain-containing protein [Deefgea]|uniref:Tim44 domain-containing protein n=1 Tax=Deefgea chitinilytica TaxID=570276 RepID=A0ABS2CB13_9NEIS|nr:MULTISPECIES: Tim44-like domain-containing protein [Deefgea]MBM5571340.1 Tim44 domain-containing protein [Deefgea chitinilytica]MBM9888573.1 Tim44 domain-containing protein [Deefgea sp. CFH1-16]
MARFAKTLMVVMMSTTLFAANIAEAKRVGGGRSGGMQRQTAPAPQRNNNVQQQPQQQPMAPAQKSGGMGMMGGVLGGLAAGSLLGYMFGSNNASGAAQGDGGIPWGTLLLLGALTAGGVMWMRRRKPAQANNGMAYAGASSAPSFPPAQPAAQQDRVFRIGEGAGSAAPAATGGLFGGTVAQQQPLTRLPDGTEVAAFLRQARASFMHMQSLNSPSQAEEMRRYMTPELFADLKDEIGSNTEVAEFPELHLNLLEAVNEGNRMIASVEFTGRVSESLHAAPVPFREIWHFVRPLGNDPRWLLAGIQQA